MLGQLAAVRQSTLVCLSKPARASLAQASLACPPSLVWGVWVLEATLGLAQARVRHRACEAGVRRGRKELVRAD